MRADIMLHLEPMPNFQGKVTAFRVVKATQNANVQPYSRESRVVKVTVEVSEDFFSKALPHAVLTVPDPVQMEVPELEGEGSNEGPPLTPENWARVWASINTLLARPS